MNLRNLFLVTAVLLVIGGLGWLLAPEATAAGFGVDLTSYGAYGAYLVRALGANAIAFGILAYLVSGMAHSPARQAVVTSFFVLQLLSLIVNLLAVLGGVVPGAAGWFGVALNLLFALAFGYFRFIRPEASMTPGMQP